MAWLIRSLAMLGAGLALAPSAAQACLPMPPPPQNPGEAPAAYEQRVEKWQSARAKADADYWNDKVRGFWDSADAVVLARVDRAARIDTGIRTQLTGMTWLKGRKKAKAFTVSTSILPCVAIDMPSKGDLVVLYVPGKESPLGAPFWVRPDAIRDERVTALLPKK